jgi:RNA polymerase sigma-70 factor, ECF subfamily
MKATRAIEEIQHASRVMDAPPRRSTDVTSTLTLPLTATRSHPVLDFDTLYRAARDDVYAYVATLLGDRSAAEDVTASAFERAYRKQGTYKAGRGSERAWLFGIARNAALDELRRRKRSAALTAEPADDAPAPADAADTALRRAALRTALAGLAPRERELIALKFHAGLDNAELATVLGVSVSNAGTLLHRAVTKLRKAIDEHA